MIRGPEGEQDVRDEKGRRVKGGPKVKFVGYQQYVDALMIDAGLKRAEPTIEEKVKKADADWAKLERFFGAAGAIVEA